MEFIHQQVDLVTPSFICQMREGEVLRRKQAYFQRYLRSLRAKN
jgi:hypothetical protein